MGYRAADASEDHWATVVVLVLVLCSGVGFIVVVEEGRVLLSCEEAVMIEEVIEQ